MGTPQSVERRPTVISAAPTPTAFYQNNTVKINSLIWLDTEVNKNEENRQAKQQLHNIIHHIKPFEDPHECQQYIQRAPTNYRIILIASGTLGRQIVPYIHNLKQISAIYIYCVDKQKNEQWAQQFHKIKGVTVQLNDLLCRLQQNLRQPVEVDEALPMNIFIDDQSTTGLNGQYVHFLLLINMLLRMRPNENDKRELLALCKEEYIGNEGHQWLIAEFEQHYSADQALEWYTRDSFLYRTLNKALRKQDIHMLYLFRWFIVDIHRELVRYQCQCPIRVYRGQLMSNSEVDRLKMSIGKLISFNSFLSASLIERQAVAFQKNGSTMNGLQRVLFEINADPQVVISKPFADVSSHSDFSSEYEVLFMLGCVFRIKDACNRGASQGWVIHMTLCSDNDHHLSQLVEHMEIENENCQPNLSSLGALLWNMGKYELAEKYLRRRLAETSLDDPSLGSTYLNLGLVLAEKGDFAESALV